MSKKIYLELLIVLLFTTAVAYFYFHRIKVADYSNCPMCDANSYTQIYNYFKGGEPNYKVNFPFSGRPVVPLLAALLPYDMITNFNIINFIFLLASVTVMYLLWRKLNIPLYLAAIGMFWLMFHWIGIIRNNLSDPVTVDVPVYFFHTLIVFIFLNKKYKWLWLLCPIAVLQKESITAFIVALLVYETIFSWVVKNKIYFNWDVFIALLICIIVKQTYTYFYPAIRPDHNSVRTAAIAVIESLSEPMRMARWFVAIFVAFGALIVVCFKQVQQKHIYDETGGFLFFMTLVGILLGLIGGSDHVRITFLSFPFIMTFILWVLKDTRSFDVAVAFMLSLPFLLLLSNSITISPDNEEMGIVAGWGVYIAGCVLILDRLNYLKKIIFIEK